MTSCRSPHRTADHAICRSGDAIRHYVADLNISVSDAPVSYFFSALDGPAALSRNVTASTDASNALDYHGAILFSKLRLATVTQR